MTDIVMSKKTLYTLVLQVIIVGVFIFIAAGSGTAGYATYRPHHKSSSNHSHRHEPPKQDLCQKDGYRYIGSYGQSESSCHHACREHGYRKSCRPTNPPSNKCYCI